MTIEDPFASSRAVERVAEAVSVLENHPFIEWPIRGDLRELVISHGRTGFVALYRVRTDTVIVLAIRHQREAGFR